jgi:hypothetical protein
MTVIFIILSQCSVCLLTILVYWEETDAINEQGAEKLFADNETISRYSHIPAEIT